MNFHYKHYPLAYFLDAMVRFGFETIELWGASPHFYVNEITAAETKAIRLEIERRDLSLICFTPEQCVYPINFASREAQVRKRSVDYFMKSLECASELGAPMLLVTPGWGYENEHNDEAWKWSRDSLMKLAKRAEELHITLALEPLTRMESNLVNNIGTLKKMLEEVSSPQLKGMIDTIPMALDNKSFKDYFDVFGDDIVHIHFIDGKPEGHLVWGDGILPLSDYMDQLTDYGYQGCLSLEYTSYKYVQDPDAAIEQSLKALAPYLN
jgi:protein FrlC